MKRDLLLFIDDILENIELIENSTRRLSKGKFKSDRDIVDATIRRLEVIGEAVKNLPSSLTNKYPETPWKEIAGFRDVLIHAYFGVNLDRLWNIVKHDLPGLKRQVRLIKTNLENAI